MRFLIIIGTAREGRNSISPAKAVRKELQNQGHEPNFFDLKEKEVPPLGNRTYKEDEEPVPEDIQDLSEGVQNSDALIIVTPEYNHSISGALKNAMDYLYPEYDKKPFMYVTVSGGSFGGVRALSHLHDITLELGGYSGPDLPISKVYQSFSKDGEILDESYEDRLEKFVKESVEFAENR